MNKDAAQGATRTPQVSEQVQRLEKAIARMSEVRSTVEERLTAILQPATPMGTAPGKDKEQVVPLAGELERLTEQIKGITSNMDNMLSRVEL